MERAKGPLNGSGELTYPDGSTYSGDVQKAQPHGHGKKVWPFEANDFQKAYTGSWNGGVMEGFGELALAEGEVYIGNFVAGYPHGLGIRKW
jgi:hypothetical protein